MRLHVIPIIGKKQLTKLTAMDVNALMRDRERAGLNPRTVRLVVILLRMALKHAVLWDLVPRNVATLVTTPSGRQYDAVALDDDQIARFIAAARGHRLEALFLMAVLVGPRVGEIRGLRWRDVDLESGQVQIRNQLVRVGKETTLAEPKTERSKRTITLPALCLAALREHRKRQLEERLIAGGRWQDGDFVFASMVGTPIDDRALIREYRALLAAADLPRIRFHDLRHTAITSMVEKGVPPHVVARIVGHTTIAMTLGTYAKVMGSSLRDTAAVIDGAFAAPNAANNVSN